MTVTFQELQEEEIDPWDTDSPRVDPPPAKGHPPGPPLDPRGLDLVKYISGQDISTNSFHHLQVRLTTLQFLSILPQQMKCNVSAFKNVCSKHYCKTVYFLHSVMFGSCTQPNCIFYKNIFDFDQNQGYLNTICLCIYRPKIQLFAKAYKDFLLWQYVVVMFKNFLY